MHTRLPRGGLRFRGEGADSERPAWARAVPVLPVTPMFTEMPGGTSQVTPDNGRSLLATFLRERRDDVLELWQRKVRALPSARTLDEQRLRDHLPELLERIGKMVEENEHGEPPSDTGRAPDLHAFQRLEEGYDLETVVREYAALRESVLELWGENTERALAAPVLHHAIDEAMATSVTHYTEARDRTIEALDHLSTAVFGSADLEELLTALGRVLLETTAAVDSVTIYLREGDRLVLRGLAGVEPGDRPGSVAIDDRSCPGVVAVTGSPLELNDAAASPLAGEPMRREKTHALYCVPMSLEGRLEGVAQMASRSAWTFSHEDKLLFRAMADRAAIAIRHNRLVAERRDAEMARDVAFEILERGNPAVVLDPAFRILRVNAELERLTRTRREDSVGRVLWDVWPNLDGAGPARAFKEAMRTRALSTFEACFSDLDVWVDVTCLPTSDGGLALLGHDITARKRVEEERERLLDSERTARREAEAALAMFDALFESSPVGLALLDPDLRYVRINGTLAAMNGKPVSEHLGRPLLEVLPTLDPTVVDTLHEVIRTRQQRVTEVMESPDARGGSFYSVYSPMLDASGRLAGVLAAVVDVTAQRQAAQALRESEERFRTLADHIPQLAWMADADGSVFWFNQRWLDYTGITVEQMRGEGWRALHHPDHRDRVEQSYARGIASGEVWEDTFPLRRQDGGWRWFLSRAVPIRDDSGRIERWFGTNTDVTEVLEQQERTKFLDEATVLLAGSLEYRENLRRLGALAVPRLADASAVDLLLEDGTLERVGVAAIDPHKEALLDELVRRYPSVGSADIGPASVLATDRPQLVTHWGRAHCEQIARNPEHLALLEGLEIASYLGVPMRARDRTLGVLNFYTMTSAHRFTDSDLRLAEDLAHRASLAIDNAMLHERERQAVRTRDDFLSTASHDLRSPLTTVALQTAKLSRRLERAGDEPLGNDWLRPRMAAVVRNVARIQELLEDLLDVSRIHAGRLSLRLEDLDLASLARDVTARMLPLYEDNNVDLRVDLGEPVTGRWDRLRLEQVLTNLMSNALKYGDGKPVEVRVEGDDHWARVTVRDRGIGISPEHLPRLFQRFERVGDPSEFHGTGLGLWIVKRIVDALGGEVTVRSEPREGTTFTVALPRA